MISIPGFLSFAKLVMTTSAPAKSAGDARYVLTSNHPINVVPYNLDSNLYQECVLTTSNAKQLTCVPIGR